MKLNNISVAFDGNQVLKNFTCTIAPKGLTAVVGESGSGKTTLFRVMCGLQKPDSGRVEQAPARIAYAFQEPRLLPWLNGLQNVMSVSDQKDEARAIYLLNSLGISNEDAKKLPAKLSGGMRQRVAIARALYYNADMYLFDEAFAGLDIDNINKVIALLKEKSKSAAVIVITHEHADLLSPDQTIVMEKL